MEAIHKLLYFNYHTFSFIFSYLHNNQSIVKTIDTITELSKLNLDNSWYYGIKLLLTTPPFTQKKNLEKGCGGWVFKDMKVSILINHNVIQKLFSFSIRRF